MACLQPRRMRFDCDEMNLCTSALRDIISTEAIWELMAYPNIESPRRLSYGCRENPDALPVERMGSDLAGISNLEI